jgi:tetratricopeptide (TPR) repeat protein
MPQTKYMVVDPRRDHSLRVPRPELSVTLGIPNACNNCHNDVAKGETAQWAADQVEKWYGKKNEPRHFSYALKAGRQMRPEAEQELAAVARRKDVRPIIRASAISLLSQYASGEAEARAIEGLEDTDELVRATSVRSLGFLPPDQLYRRLAPMLRDPIRAVRAEAARLLSAVPRRLFKFEDRQAFDSALREYLDGQQALNDQAAAHLNMGVIYANLAQEELDRATSREQVLQATEKSYQAYRQALKIDPEFIPAKINLAMLCDQRGDKREAEQLFREIIRQEPEMAEPQYSLGLLLAEDEKRLAEAAEFLGKAAELSPENARIHYNYGLALQKLGRMDEAEAALKRALDKGKTTPAAPQFLYALAILYRQENQWDRAIACVEQLQRMDPENPQWAALLEDFRAGK